MHTLPVAVPIFSLSVTVPPVHSFLNPDPAAVRAGDVSVPDSALGWRRCSSGVGATCGAARRPRVHPLRKIAGACGPSRHNRKAALRPVRNVRHTQRLQAAAETRLRQSLTAGPCRQQRALRCLAALVWSLAVGSPPQVLVCVNSGSSDRCAACGTKLPCQVRWGTEETSLHTVVRISTPGTCQTRPLGWLR